VCNSTKSEVTCRGSIEQSGIKLQQAFQVFATKVPDQLYHSISIGLRDLVTLDAAIFAGIRFESLLLQSSDLIYIDRDAFRGTEQSVESLYIYRTKLTNAPPKHDFFAALRSLVKLKKLTITHNELRDIPDR